MENNNTNEEQFEKVCLLIEERSVKFWRWYKQNCAIGVFSKISITLLTAFLIGDASLREFRFYPESGLISIWAILVTIFVNLEIWWNPWDKRKKFLIKGQRLDCLAIEAKAEFSNCKSENEEIEIIKSINNDFISILRETIDEYKY